MARLIRRKPAVKQPQHAAEIDWSNPITRGLIAFAVPSVTPNGKPVLTSLGVANAAVTSMAGQPWYSGGFNQNIPEVTIAGLAIRRTGLDGVYVVNARPAGNVNNSELGIGISAYSANKGIYFNVVYSDYTQTGVAASLATDPDGQKLFLAGTFSRNGTQDIWADGVKVASTPASDKNLFVSFNTLFSPDSGGGNDSSSLPLLMSGVWSRKLSDAELRSLNEQPFQLFRQAASQLPIIPPVVYTPPTSILGAKMKRLLNSQQPQYTSSPSASAGGLVAAVSGTNAFDVVTRQPLTNSGSTVAIGKRGRAFVTNGTTSYLQENFPAQALVDYCTIVVITTPASLPASGFGAPFAAFETVDGTRGGKALGISPTGNIRLLAATSNGVVYASGDTVIAPGQLVVAAATMPPQGNGCLMYVNGVKQNVTNGLNGSAFWGNGTPTQQLTIGKGNVGDVNGTTAYYAGSTELVLVFNRMFTDAELLLATTNPWAYLKPAGVSRVAVSPYVAPALLTGGSSQRRSIVSPQSPGTVIDWSNPITRGLSLAFLPDVARNLVDNTTGSPRASGSPPTFDTIKGRKAIASGSYMMKEPVSASDPVARYDSVVNITVFTHATQPVKENSNYCFVRGNGSSSPSWAVGVHGGSFNGPFAMLAGTAFTPIGNDYDMTQPRSVLLTGNGTTAVVYVDGKQYQSQAYTPANAATQYVASQDRAVLFGSANPSAGAQQVRPHLALRWERVLSAAEIRSISENPYQVFKAEQRRTWAQIDSVSSGITSASGSSVGLSSLTAIARALAQAVGSSPGVSSVAGTGGAVWTSTGSAAGVSTPAATANSVLGTVGAVMGTSSLTSVANAIAQSVAAAAGTSVVGGAARWVFNAAGSSSGTTGVAGTGISITQATGMTTGLGNAAGSGGAVVPSGGSANGVGAAFASAVSISTSYGSASGLATLAGNGCAIWQVGGSSAGIALVAGTSNAVAGANGSSGSAVGTSTVSGTGGAVWVAAGAAAGTSNIDGRGNVIWLVNANATGFGTAAGTGQSIVGANGSVGSAIGTSIASATAAWFAQGVGAATGASNVSGQGISLAQAVASAVGASTTSAGGVIIGASVGSAVGSSNAQSVVVIIHQSSGMSISASAINAVSGAIKSAIAAANGRATVSGVTQGGIHYTAQGDKFNITLMFSEFKVTLENNQLNVELNK